MSFFQRFSCGCIGIKLTDPVIDQHMDHRDGKIITKVYDAIVIKACDNQDYDIQMCWSFRDMHRKTHENLTVEEEKILHDKLARLILDGNQLNVMKGIMGAFETELKIRNLEAKVDQNFKMCEKIK